MRFKHATKSASKLRNGKVLNLLLDLYVENWIFNQFVFRILDTCIVISASSWLFWGIKLSFTENMGKLVFVDPQENNFFGFFLFQLKIIDCVIKFRPWRIFGFNLKSIFYKQKLWKIYWKTWKIKNSLSHKLKQKMRKF